MYSTDFLLIIFVVIAQLVYKWRKSGRRVHLSIQLHHFLFQLALADQETTDRKQTGNAGDAGQVAPRVIMA